MDTHCRFDHSLLRLGLFAITLGTISQLRAQTIVGDTISNNLYVTNNLDMNGTAFTQGAVTISSINDYRLKISSDANAVYLEQRKPTTGGDWIWQYYNGTTTVTSAKLDAANIFSLYSAGAAKVSLNPTSKTLTLDAATLMGTGGNLTAGGAVTVTGAFTASSGITNTNGSFTAGGTNQNITLTPSGTGYTLVQGSARFTAGGTFGYTANVGANNGLILGTVAKATAPSGGQGSIQINSNDATNLLQGFVSLITDSTASNRRLSIGAIEQGVTWRTVTLAEGGGNVGIGTSTPFARLAAVGTISAGSAGVAAVGTNVASITASASKAQLYLARSVSTWGDTWWEWTHDSDNKLKLGFSTVPQAEFANGTTAFFGSVGIGTMTPTAKLQVGITDAGSINEGIELDRLGAATSKFSMKLISNASGYYRGALEFTQNGGPLTEVISIGNEAAGGAGNVGIGTISPVSYATLDVNTTGHKGIHTMDSTNGGLLIGYDGPTVQARTTADANTANLILQGWGGNVGIGTTNPTQKLSVAGTIRAYAVIVDTGWSDYVFDKDYRLTPLSEVESHIKEHKHLPGIPSAAEVAEHGVSLGDMQSKLLAKVEELTLHLIAQEKRMIEQQKEFSSRISRLEHENERLRNSSLNP